MAARHRIDLPGIAQYIVQHGSGRHPGFPTDADRIVYLQALRDSARRADCNVHAYVLMDDHVHLLVTPLAAGCVARMMESLAGSGARRGNGCVLRTASRGNARYACSPVLTHDALLRCQRHLERHPVHAGIVRDPARYRWSSHRGNTSPPHDPLLTPHRAWLALGTDTTDRRRAWRMLVLERDDPGETDAIRQHLQRQHLPVPDRIRSALDVGRKSTSVAACTRTAETTTARAARC